MNIIEYIEYDVACRYSLTSSLSQHFTPILEVDMMSYILLYLVTTYGIDTCVHEINRSLALTRNNLSIITNLTHDIVMIRI